MGGIPNIGDEKKFQGQNHDLKAFDEATEIPNSSTASLSAGPVRQGFQPDNPCPLTFNPPTTVEGRWVIQVFRSLARPETPNPARSGEIRYFTTY
jgi:hypothetical protein